MINKITVPMDLAEPVNLLMHSIRPTWQYVPLTNNFYIQAKDPEVRKDLDDINRKYGPVIDTQRFTDELYNDKQQRYKQNGIHSFDDIRNNPKSRYNTVFPELTRLINHLHSTYIPSGYDIVRLMSNMQTIRPKWSMNAPHPDYTQKDYITILYYVNDSDGDTFFFEGSNCINRIKPVKGQAAMYPSSVMHAGSTPVKAQTRIVVNICFGPK